MNLTKESEKRKINYANYTKMGMRKDTGRKL